MWLIPMAIVWLAPPATRVRAPPTRMAADSRLSYPALTLEIIDAEGDLIRFVPAEGKLQLWDGDDLQLPAIRALTYARADAAIRADGEDVDGDTAECDVALDRREPRDLTLDLARLGVLAAQARTEWLRDAPVELPQPVEALLVDDELRASRPGTCLLWATLLQVYPDEPSALAAVARNSAIVLPYLNRPAYISGSWREINEKMGPEDALDVVTKNPGILCCNPGEHATRRAWLHPRDSLEPVASIAPSHGPRPVCCVTLQCPARREGSADSPRCSRLRREAQRSECGVDPHDGIGPRRHRRAARPLRVSDGALKNLITISAKTVRK